MSKDKARLLVRIVKGRMLRPLCPYGKTDPFVKVSLGKATHFVVLPDVDNPKPKNTDPVWNSEVSFVIEDTKAENLGKLKPLRIDVMDKKKPSSSDKSIGHVVIQLSELMRGKSHIQEWPLEGSSPKDKRGTILVHLFPVDFGGIELPTDKAARSIPKGELRKLGITSIPEPRALINFKKKDVSRTVQIAEGSFGIVYKGKTKGIKGTIVVKDMNVTEDAAFDEWKKEIEMMSHYRSDYVVDVFGYVYTNRVVTIVMEYMAKGSLWDIIHEKKLAIGPLLRLKMARQCARGMAYLHSNGVLHRDIKSLNILCKDDFQCKLADFGCAKLIGDKKIHTNPSSTLPRGAEPEKQTANVGSPLWMAPEVPTGKYTYSSDVYSMGLVFYELLEGKVPKWDPYKVEVILPETYASQGIVAKCMHKNEAMRPTAADVLRFLTHVIMSICNTIKEKYPKEFKSLNKKNNNFSYKDDEPEFLCLLSKTDKSIMKILKQVPDVHIANFKM